LRQCEYVQVCQHMVFSNYLAPTLPILAGLFGGLAGVFLRIAAELDLAQSAGTTSRALMLRALALASYACGFVLFAVALRNVTLPIAYPVMVAVSMLVVFGFAGARGEAMTAVNICGALLIMAGVWALVR
jgi:small multidrug resistance pump